MNPAAKVTVGMGATICVGSDRYAATVVGIPNARTVVIQRDRAERLDKRGPYTEDQKYRHHKNPAAALETFTYRRNGRWIRKGSGMRSGTPLAIGARNTYRDPCF